ncbi:MAG: hypothetical protein M1476_00135 [Candidatus Thermoplasmatota archaeon]|nr:hypothetical protein [Candidatus Thermoplasmatota archaeon]
MNKLAGILGIIFILFLAPAVAVGSSSQYVPPFSSQIAAPSYTSTGQNFALYVNNSAGFTNYSVTVYMSGENLTGASPLSSYHDFKASNPDFIVNVTAPLASQTIYFLIVSTADYGSSHVVKKSSYQISVITPIILRAEVTNQGTQPIYNLSLSFTLSDSTGIVYQGSKTVSKILPGQTVSVNLTYTSNLFKDGEYSLNVSSQNSTVRINGQGSSSISNFYYGQPPNYNWIFYIAAGVVIFMIFFALSAGRRPTAASRPKWKK